MLIYNTLPQYRDNLDEPLSNGRLAIYNSAGTTLIPIYYDQGKQSIAPNPFPLSDQEKEMLDLYRGLDEEEFASLTEDEAKIYEDLENRYLSPEQEANIRDLRNAALEEQADYKRYSEAMHAPTIVDVPPGKVFTNDNQGILGKAYDIGSYPLRHPLS